MFLKYNDNKQNKSNNITIKLSNFRQILLSNGLIEILANKKSNFILKDSKFESIHNLKNESLHVGIVIIDGVENLNLSSLRFEYNITLSIKFN